jgi:hypothetical protein
MTTGVALSETMNGWMQLNGEHQSRDFAFSLRAFTARVFRLTVPRSFRGRVRLDGQEMHCQGELTLRPGGPHYWLDFEHPELGQLHVAGRKQYSLRRLRDSLISCPMTVYRGGEAVGTAEVRYQDSMLAFPFKALRLTHSDNAFGEYGASL